MFHKLEQWCDRNFQQVMLVLVGAMIGACLVFVFQSLGGVVCPEIPVGTMP